MSNSGGFPDSVVNLYDYADSFELYDGWNRPTIQDIIGAGASSLDGASAVGEFSYDYGRGDDYSDCYEYDRSRGICAWSQKTIITLPHDLSIGR